MFAGDATQGLDWALARTDLDHLLEILGDREGNDVVELGAGAGTVELARGVARLGGRLTSVEHDGAWVAQVSDALRNAGFSDCARVIHAPLEPHPLAQAGTPWYSRAALCELPERIDLLLVDGPPGSIGEMARAPALEALADRLAADAVVVLDDVHRRGERATVERWESRTGFRFSTPQSGRIAVGSRPRAVG